MLLGRELHDRLVDLVHHLVELLEVLVQLLQIGVEHEVVLLVGLRLLLERVKALAYAERVLLDELADAVVVEGVSRGSYLPLLEELVFGYGGVIVCLV